MKDQIAEAVVKAAELGGAKPKTWHVGPQAAVMFSDGPTSHPFDGMTVTHWSVD